MTPLGQRVAAGIRAARRQQRLTQRELAERCDLSTQYVQLVETGRRSPRLAMVDRIARALAVDPVQFFGGGTA